MVHPPGSRPLAHGRERAGPFPISLVLGENEGAVSGSWESLDLGNGTVSGTRVSAYLKLTLHNDSWAIPFTGEFTSDDTITGSMDLGWFILPVTLARS